MIALRACPLLAGLALFAVSPLFAQSPAVGVADATSQATEPVAEPAAVVRAGHARFTVLTPELIRMEWAADGKFEDHASFVFLNRRLPVPNFKAQCSLSETTKILTIRTSVLTLTYDPTVAPNGDGRFTPGNLTVAFTLDGAPVVWNPGLGDMDNL